MKIYYILNTVSEFDAEIRGYYSSLEKAEEALKDCSDWYRSKGKGRIYEVELDSKDRDHKLVYEN